MLHNPELPLDRRKKQTQSVELRAQKFKDFVAKVIAGERLAMNDLVKQPVSLEGLLGEENDEEAA